MAKVEQVVRNELVLTFDLDVALNAGVALAIVELRPAPQFGLIGGFVTPPHPYEAIALDQRIAARAGRLGNLALADGVVHTGTLRIETQSVVGAAQIVAKHLAFVQRGKAVGATVVQGHCDS
ncbi:hypothetical protein D3C81_1532990 [compost metagenome]